MSSIIPLMSNYDRKYWINFLGRGLVDEGQGIAVDSSGNVYITGMTTSQGAGNYDVLIAKYNTNGVIQWQRLLGGVLTDYGQDIAVDSSGNVYIIGDTASQGAGDYDVLIAKYNTNGVIQWQRTLGGPFVDFGRGIAVDSSGNVYITGFSSSQVPGTLIAKYNTNGVIQWQRLLGGALTEYGQGIAVDSSGNVYITGYTASQGAGNNDVLIAKYNTNGVIQWQRTLGGALRDNGQDIAVDSSGNVYITGYTASQGAGNIDVLIAKYNTNGVIQWQRTLGGALDDYGFGIAVDSSGNVYITGYTASQGAGNNDVLIAKYNTNGVIQWQRTLGDASFDYGHGIAVDSSGNVYITGYAYTENFAGSSEEILIVKVPDDGSITGKYGYYTYQESALTNSQSTLIDAARTLTNATGALTDTTSTLTDATATLIHRAIL